MVRSYSPISGKLSRDNRIDIASSQTRSLFTGSRKSVAASKLSTSSSSYSNQILSKSSSSFSTLLMNCFANRTIVLSRCREGRLCRSSSMIIASLQNGSSSFSSSPFRSTCLVILTRISSIRDLCSLVKLDGSI